MYCTIDVNENGLKSPLQWWKDHDKQFLTISIFAQQILGVPRSRIEIGEIFNVANILTSLHAYFEGDVKISCY